MRKSLLGPAVGIGVSFTFGVFIAGALLNEVSTRVADAIASPLYPGFWLSFGLNNRMDDVLPFVLVVNSSIYSSLAWIVMWLVRQRKVTN